MMQRSRMLKNYYSYKNHFELLLLGCIYCRIAYSNIYANTIQSGIEIDYFKKLYDYLKSIPSKRNIQRHR